MDRFTALYYSSFPVRSLPAHSVRAQPRSPGTLPRFSSVPRPGLETSGSGGADTGAGAGAALGRLAVRLTHRAERAELLVKILRGENIPINYRTQTASTSVKLAILPSKLAKVGQKTTLLKTVLLR